MSAGTGVDIPMYAHTQIVSDIDFTICKPQHTVSPFLAKCLASKPEQCPIFSTMGVFPCASQRCDPKGDQAFHLSMACHYRDAFSEEFYTWLSTLDFEKDHPIVPTLAFVQAHHHPPIFLTNRDERCRPGTLAFFQKHAVAHRELRMRPHRDYRPLWDFKLEQIAQLASHYPHILWLDDQKPPVVFENVTWLHPDLLG